MHQVGYTPALSEETHMARVAISTDSVKFCASSGKAQTPAQQPDAQPQPPQFGPPTPANKTLLIAGVIVGAGVVALVLALFFTAAVWVVYKKAESGISSSGNPGGTGGDTVGVNTYQIFGDGDLHWRPVVLPSKPCNQILTNGLH